LGRSIALSLLIGDTGKLAYGNLKIFTIQTATPREVSLGTITLPTVEGATDQISFTIQDSDLPTITPNPVSMKYVACVVASGKCVTAATVNYRILKNGSSVVSSNSTGVANQFWTHSHFRWFDVVVGDTLDVRMWSNQTDTNLDYACIMIYPASIVLSKINTILSNLTYTLGTTTNFPLPTGSGLRSVVLANTASTNFCLIPNLTSVGNGTGCLGVNTTIGTIAIIPSVSSTSFGILRTSTGGDGGSTATNASNSSTNISIQKQAFPNTVTFREVLR
jgi:hypothetical protein